MANAPFKFTIRALDALKPTSKRQIFRDTEMTGLILICYPLSKKQLEAGAQKPLKVFFKRRSINNIDEKIRLGEFSKSFGPEEARLAAAKFNLAIDEGQNPAEARRALKDEPTLADLMDSYLSDHKTKAGHSLGERTKSEYRSIFRVYFQKVAKQKPSTINVETILQTLRLIKNAPASQVKAATMFCFLLNHWKPGRGTKLHAEVKGHQILPKIEPRERYLSDEETGRLFAALEGNRLADFFALALLTGQRRSNVAAMSWKDLDLKKGHWVIDRAETKGRKTLIIDLTNEAVAILEARKTQSVVNARWVFPGDGKSGHLVEPRGSWQKLLKDAKLEDLRLHDLRHTLASWIINGGHSIDVVGKALGHRSNAASRLYAHISQQTVGTAVSGVVSEKLKAVR